MNIYPVSILFTSSRVDLPTLPADPRAERSVRRQGRLAEGADGIYLLFRDTVEAAGPVEYSVKFSTQRALIRRKGAVPLRQPLAVGVSLPGSYGSPYGILATEATALVIESEWGAARGRGRAALLYSLNVQQENAGHFQMKFIYSR